MSTLAIKTSMKYELIAAVCKSHTTYNSQTKLFRLVIDMWELSEALAWPLWLLYERFDIYCSRRAKKFGKIDTLCLRFIEHDMPEACKSIVCSFIDSYGVPVVHGLEF